mgnify:CR=1 FL=1
MTWTLSTVVAEIFYTVIGILFALNGIKALKDSGLNYSLDIQTHRAAVRVELNKKKSAKFYIYYKRMYDELEKLVPAVESLNGIIDSFSYFFKVY